MFLATLFLTLSPILGLVLLTYINRKLLAYKLHRLTRWSWPIHFIPVSGGIGVGPNTEIDSTTRLANLEAAVYSGGIVTNPALLQGGLALFPQKITVAGAIALPAKSGVVDLSGTTVLAMTLGLPVAGLPSVGGDDGKILVILNDTAAKAHTITTPTNGLNGSLHIATMSATASTFSVLILLAIGGTWIIISNSNCAIT